MRNGSLVWRCALRWRSYTGRGDIAGMDTSEGFPNSAEIATREGGCILSSTDDA